MNNVITDFSHHIQGVHPTYSDANNNASISDSENNNSSPVIGGHNMQTIAESIAQAASLQITTPPSIPRKSHSIEVLTKQIPITLELLAQKIETLGNASKKLRQVLLQEQEISSLAPSLQPQDNNVSDHPNQATEQPIRAAFDKVKEEQNKFVQQAQREIEVTDLLAERLNFIQKSIQQKYNGIPYPSLPLQERRALESFIEHADKVQATLQQRTVEIQARTAALPSLYAHYLAQAAEGALTETVAKIDTAEERPEDPKAIEELLEPVSIAFKITTIALNAAQVALAEATITRATLSSEQESNTTTIKALEDHITRAADLVIALSTVQEGAEDTIQSLYRNLGDCSNFKELFYDQCHERTTTYSTLHYGCRLHSLIPTSLSELAQQSYQSAVEMNRVVPPSQPQILENWKYPYQQATTRHHLNQLIQFPLIPELTDPLSFEEIAQSFKGVAHFSQLAQKAYQDQIKFYFQNHPNLPEESLSSASFLVQDDVKEEVKQARDYSEQHNFNSYGTGFPISSPHFSSFYHANMMKTIASKSIKRIDRSLLTHHENDPIKSLEVCLAKKLVVAAIKAARPIVEASANYEKRYKLQYNVEFAKKLLIGDFVYGGLKNSIEIREENQDPEEVADLKKVELVIQKIKATASDDKIHQISQSMPPIEQAESLDQDLFNWIKAATINQPEIATSIAAAAQQALPALTRLGYRGTADLLHLRTLNTTTDLQDACWHKITARFVPLRELVQKFSYAATLDKMDSEQKSLFDKAMSVANNAAQTSDTLISATRFAGIIHSRPSRTLVDLTNRLGPQVMTELDNHIQNIQLKTGHAYALAKEAMNAYDDFYNQFPILEGKLKLAGKKTNPDFKDPAPIPDALNIHALKILQLNFNKKNIPNRILKNLHAKFDKIISESQSTLEEAKAIRANINQLLP